MLKLTNSPSKKKTTTTTNKQTNNKRIKETKHQHGANLLYGYSEKPPNSSRMGIRRTYLSLKSQVPTGGGGGGGGLIK